VNSLIALRKIVALDFRRIVSVDYGFGRLIDIQTKKCRVAAAALDALTGHGRPPTLP
jgi:hypothetical protein